MSAKIKKARSGTRPTPAQWGFMLLFVLPPLCGFVFMTVIPMITSAYTSFFDYSGYGEMTFLGWDNYKTLFSDPHFGNAVINDLIILLGKELMIVVLAVFFALTVTRLRFSKGETNVLRFVFYLPNILSSVVIAKMWKYFFDLNLFGIITGLEQPNNGWIAEYPLAIITFVASWCGIGGFMIILIAAINNVSNELYEAAGMDGAGQWRQLFSITIPLVWPQIKYMITSIILSIVGSNMNFVKLFIGDGTGSFTVMGVYEYDYAFTRFRMGYANAVAVVLMIATLIVTYLLNYVIMKKEDD